MILEQLNRARRKSEGAKIGEDKIVAALETLKVSGDDNITVQAFPISLLGLQSAKIERGALLSAREAELSAPMVFQEIMVRLMEVYDFLQLDENSQEEVLESLSSVNATRMLSYDVMARAHTHGFVPSLPALFLHVTTSMMSEDQDIFLELSEPLVQDVKNYFTELINIFDAESILPKDIVGKLTRLVAQFSDIVPDYLSAIDKLDVKPGMDIVEVGAGYDMIFIFLADLKGANVTVYEPGVSETELLKNYVPEFCPNVAIKGDFLDSDLTDVDAVLMRKVLSSGLVDHNKKIKIIEKAAEILKPGGTLVVGYGKGGDVSYNADEREQTVRTMSSAIGDEDILQYKDKISGDRTVWLVYQKAQDVDHVPVLEKTVPETRIVEDLTIRPLRLVVPAAQREKILAMAEQAAAEYETRNQGEEVMIEVAEEPIVDMDSSFNLALPTGVAAKKITVIEEEQKDELRYGRVALTKLLQDGIDNEQDIIFVDVDVDRMMGRFNKLLNDDRIILSVIRDIFSETIARIGVNEEQVVLWLLAYPCDNVTIAIAVDPEDSRMRAEIRGALELARRTLPLVFSRLLEEDINAPDNADEFDREAVKLANEMRDRIRQTHVKKPSVADFSNFVCEEDPVTMSIACFHLRYDEFAMRSKLLTSWNDPGNLNKVLDIAVDIVLVVSKFKRNIVLWSEDSRFLRGTPESIFSNTTEKLLEISKLSKRKEKVNIIQTLLDDIDSRYIDMKAMLALYYHQVADESEREALLEKLRKLDEPQAKELLEELRGFIEIRMWKVRRKTSPSPIHLPKRESAEPQALPLEAQNDIAEEREAAQPVKNTQSQPDTTQASDKTTSEAEKYISEAKKLLSLIKEGLSSPKGIDLTRSIGALNNLLEKASETANKEEGERISLIDSKLKALLELYKHKRRGELAPEILEEAKKLQNHLKELFNTQEAFSEDSSRDYSINWHLLRRRIPTIAKVLGAITTFLGSVSGSAYLGYITFGGLEGAIAGLFALSLITAWILLSRIPFIYSFFLNPDIENKRDKAYHMTVNLVIFFTLTAVLVNTKGITPAMLKVWYLFMTLSSLLTELPVLFSKSVIKSERTFTRTLASMLKALSSFLSRHLANLFRFIITLMQVSEYRKKLKEKKEAIEESHQNMIEIMSKGIDAEKLRTLTRSLNKDSQKIEESSLELESYITSVTKELDEIEIEILSIIREVETLLEKAQLETENMNQETEETLGKIQNWVSSLKEKQEALTDIIREINE